MFYTELIAGIFRFIVRIQSISLIPIQFTHKYLNKIYYSKTQKAGGITASGFCYQIDYRLKSASVTAPSEALLTVWAYLARTPRG